MTARTLADGAADIGRRAMLRARAFEFSHRALLDAVAAAVVGLLAIAGWYATFALFNE